MTARIELMMFAIMPVRACKKFPNDEAREVLMMDYIIYAIATVVMDSNKD